MWLYYCTDSEILHFDDVISVSGLVVFYAWPILCSGLGRANQRQEGMNINWRIPANDLLYVDQRGKCTWVFLCHAYFSS